MRDTPEKDLLEILALVVAIVFALMLVFGALYERWQSQRREVRERVETISAELTRLRDELQKP